MPPRVLIVSNEALGIRMSGPAIRYWHLAQALAAQAEVTLAAPGPVSLTSASVNIQSYERVTGHKLRGLLAECDVVVVAGLLLRHYPFLTDAAQPMVVDLYDPFIIENLEIHSARLLTEQEALHRINLRALEQQLARGDYFLCASETQRDFWLGMLAGAGRINPRTLAADRTLRHLIDVVAFGVPDEPPVQMRHALKGVIPGIETCDWLIYWGGGLWEWFDPLTAIRAVAELVKHHPRVKLFFAGIRHPNPDVPLVRRAAEAQRLSAELGMTGRQVFFNQWVPYAERADYLLDADVGLSLHYDHVETRLAYRTRLLDYLWAGLPMVVTRGDVVAQQAEGYGLARLVGPQDTAFVVAALQDWLNEPQEAAEARRARAREWASKQAWSRVVGPLAEYCRQPVPAADRIAPAERPPLRVALLPKAWQSLRTRGLAGLVQDVRLYLKL